MKKLEPGTEIDGFLVHECIHAGGMAHIYRVSYASGAAATRAHFPLVMKVPRMTAGDGAENIVGFEMELQIMPLLHGPHVPRFVAAGDLLRLPYLVMEHVAGRTLQEWLDAPDPIPIETVARLGTAIAQAAHSLHQQNCVHMDLKPGNVLIQEEGHAVVLDFGLSCHAHLPDLLAEELRQAIGSPAWIAPEQIVGVRGDLRSDIFALGVMLYELTTGTLPFGAPRTPSGQRQRMWMAPKPPRALRPDVPLWLQEIILRCLEPAADQRYASAAELALDLQHPQQVPLTARAQRLQAPSLWRHLRHWMRAAGMQYHPSPAPSQALNEVPILMVAVPHEDVSDATLYSLRQAVARSLSTRPGARLMVTTVISPTAASTTDSQRSETQLHRMHLARLKQWGQRLHTDGHGVSYHVLEASDVAHALVRHAEGNHVGLLILGAATHGLQLQRWLSTVPIRVARDAPCTVILVKSQLPFAALDTL